MSRAPCHKNLPLALIREVEHEENTLLGAEPHNEASITLYRLD